MKLKNKTFLYSLCIALIVGLFIFLYMIFLLPSMLMDYRISQNLNHALSFHQTFVKNENFDGIKGDNAINSFGLKIPKKGYAMEIHHLSFHGKLQLTDKKIQALLDRLRENFRQWDVNNSSLNESSQNDFSLGLSEEELKNILNKFIEPLQKEFQIDLLLKKDSFSFEPKRQKFHFVDKNSILTEFAVENPNSGTEYTSYFGFSEKADYYLISINSVITPTTKDIKAVVFGAVPVILPVLILLAFAISAWYSKKIIHPIMTLAKDADSRRQNTKEPIPLIKIEGKDEIAHLAESLNLLYLQQEKALRQLEAENKRQEVFMKASSHQLKTPIAAAELLVDGMISKIGKFSDRESYLPKVKSQLNNIKKIVNEILHMNRLAKKPTRDKIPVHALIQSISQAHAIDQESKNIKILFHGHAFWTTDGEILYQILENLIQNALSYTESGGQIDIQISADEICMMNSPAEIEKEILPMLFEPFVTGNEKGDGHGLGLYIVKYFTELLNMYIEVQTKNHQVIFTLSRKEC